MWASKVIYVYNNIFLLISACVATLRDGGHTMATDRGKVTASALGI